MDVSLKETAAPNTFPTRAYEYVLILQALRLEPKYIYITISLHIEAALRHNSTGA